jgi:hypothetical protein
VQKDKYLIRSIVNPLLEYKIVEGSEVKGSNKVVAEAVFQKCDDPNANGHSFPRRVLAAAVDEARENIRNRHFLGELDHPENIKDVNRIATVSLKNVSHLITNLEMDGDYVVGKFETLDTPNGMILASLLKDKIKTGVSIRAITDQDISYGSDKINSITEFTLITYDAVHNPAYSDAYVKSIMASVYKLDSDYSERRISVSEGEFKAMLAEAITAAVKRIYANSKR